IGRDVNFHVFKAPAQRLQSQDVSRSSSESFPEANSSGFWSTKKGAALRPQFKSRSSRLFVRLVTFSYRPFSRLSLLELSSSFSPPVEFLNLASLHLEAVLLHSR